MPSVTKIAPCAALNSPFAIYLDGAAVKTHKNFFGVIDDTKGRQHDRNWDQRSSLSFLMG